MSESDFQRAICERLAWRRRRVLRVSDGTDARHGVYGLRALVDPPIDSTGADLLVLPATGMPVIVARSAAEVEAALAQHAGPFFAELKDPHRRGARVHAEQADWIRYVTGGPR